MSAEAAHAAHSHRNRLRHFFLPDGRRVHIAASPEEADTLKQKLSRQYPDQEFDLYIHGSPEHVCRQPTAMLEQDKLTMGG